MKKEKLTLNEAMEKCIVFTNEQALTIRGGTSGSEQTSGTEDDDDEDVIY